MNAGLLKEDRVEKFKEMLELSERYKHKNQNDFFLSEFVNASQ